MAEIIGVVSAGFGIAAFAVQITDTVRGLRGASGFIHNKARGELELLIRRLEALRKSLLSLEHVQSSSSVEQAVTNCQLAYSSVDVILQDVTQKLSRLQGSKLKLARHTTSIAEQLRAARERLDSVIEDLTLTCVLVVYARHTAASDAQNASSISSPNAASNLSPATNPVSTTQLSHLASASSRRKLVNCALHHLWGWEYSPLSTLSRPCDAPECTAKRYRWGLKFALTRYGVPFMVSTSLEFLWGAGKYSLRPALSLERVVNYTSPGFEALWHFANGNLSVLDTQQQFRELARCDPSLKDHIHPGGRNYVQELLYYGPGNQEAQFQLLRFFVCELGMSLENLDQKFLVRCAEWIGEGCHLNLLEAILEYGFDPSCSDSPVYQDWPAVCSPNWRCEEYTPDPFFIEYLAILGDACPGFGGLTPLHDAVLRNNTRLAQSLLSPSTLHPQYNFLGQTALHLAVCNTDMVQLLVNAGHDTDVIDKRGNTPLMYAAATGNISTVRLLLKEGANPFLRDHKLKRNFIEYAAARGKWHLIIDTLVCINEIFPPKVYQYFVLSALMSLVCSVRTMMSDAWSNIFAKLVGSLTDPNIKVDDADRDTENNNLLHYISNPEDAAMLFKCGFNMINSANSNGETALFSLSGMLDGNLTQFFLDQGMKINHTNHRGRTFIFSLLSKLSHLNSRTWSQLDSLRVCLSRGLNILSSDSCRCPCSPRGCFYPAAFDVSFLDPVFSRTPSFVWALEFVTQVEESGGRDLAKTVILGLLRRSCFDRLEMTHVCCHRGRGIPEPHLSERDPLPESEIEEILDEEKEFIAQLEKEMTSFSSMLFSALRRDWMVILKTKYEEQVQAAETQKQRSDALYGPSKDKYHVDYANDTYYSVFSCRLDSKPAPISNSMAEYIIWFEHQYNRYRANQPGYTAAQTQAWYDKRLAWILELMKLMELSAATVAEAIKVKIKWMTWHEPNVPDKQCIIAHFLSSIASRKGTEGC
ncbi:hypothetical protein ASPCAL00248 [Aspergillus calidoustus]|uniref:Uncharacterized protein n=1 Tax=Aspergillus calidoustus TaxID=454130 RepID=A0A0U5C0S4_ASPCI|nr:hypothetical protein ASPCAL00248 [Aspergillus calidoustus]